MIFKMTLSFLWENVFLRRRKLFKIAQGRHKITQYVDCVTKELRSIPVKLLKIVQENFFRNKYQIYNQFC